MRKRKKKREIFQSLWKCFGLNMGSEMELILMGCSSSSSSGDDEDTSTYSEDTLKWDFNLLIALCFIKMIYFLKGFGVEQKSVYGFNLRSWPAPTPTPAAGEQQQHPQQRRQQQQQQQRQQQRRQQHAERGRLRHPAQGRRQQQINTATTTKFSAGRHARTVGGASGGRTRNGQIFKKVNSNL